MTLSQKLGLAAICVFAAIVIFAISLASANSDTRKAESDVRAGLRDPYSAQFSDVAQHDTKSGGSVVCGYINAKNAFGAYVGPRRFVSIVLGDEIVSDVDSEQSDEQMPGAFDDVWRVSGCAP